MQMAAAYAAIANGGILRPPHDRARDRRQSGAEPAGRRVISTQTAASVRDDAATACWRPAARRREASIPGYDLAGKTGTANKVDPATASTPTTRYVASFMGFAPASDPKLLVAVIVDEPQGAIYGGQVAAPAFQKIMRFALPYLASTGSIRRRWGRRRPAGAGDSGADEALRDVMGAAARRRRATSRSPALAYDNRARRAGDAVLLRARLHARRARLRARGGRARRGGARRRAAAGARRPEVSCRRRARRWRRPPHASTATRRASCASSA